MEPDRILDGRYLARISTKEQAAETVCVAWEAVLGGEKPSDPKTFNKAMYRLCKRFGLPYTYDEVKKLRKQKGGKE